MSFPRLLICFCLAFPATAPLAQSTDDGRQIAHALHGCMEAAEDRPREMLACAEQAESRWREEVEHLTGRLDKSLGGEARDALEASREAWMVSHEADLALVDAYHDQLIAAELGEPAMLRLSRQLHRNALLETRADYLRRLLEGLGTLPDPTDPSPTD
ncbi:lysozyme inhibitor LprI family protein [Halomonas ramblicola]|uniref:lysozyme inhibitor LprI family protein n=1 Tax=Halomonas ramblicola TaxID=747349 RepID=UPI0025B51D94|nr:lysozyme inhibitor LprI family protein [Halomonas ramblicola]MDN3521699.1 lysozyme inhibitor LprI family protein [Halomonas ramblicola]